MNENEYISASQRGARISGLRADRGFTLRELAGRLGVSASTLSRYEAGLVERIPQPTMEKLAVLLGTSPAYLQYGRDEPETSAAEGAAPQIQSKPTDYLHIYRASELSRLYRAGQLDEREFVLIVDEDTALAPRILPGDQVTVLQDGALRADCVYLLLRADGRLCLRDVRRVDVHGVQDAFLLKTRAGDAVEVYLPGESYHRAYQPVGVCVKLESRQI